MNYITKALLIALVLFTGVACSHFDDLNTDPNKVSEGSPSFLLTSSQRIMMDRTWDEWFNGRRGNQLAQYWASNQYSSESRYEFRTSISNSYWRDFYAGGLNDLGEIIKLNTERPEDFVGFGDTENQIAVARILKVWLYQNITDCWGDVPYSQALKGAEFPSPKYDTQSAIYLDLLAELTAASSQINTSPTNQLLGDKVYDGDMALWKKFANSLKLRVAIRMIDANGTAASAAITQAVAAGVFTSNADNALLVYGTDPSNNPLHENAKERDDFAASNVMLDILKDLNDPRMGFFYAPSVTSGEFVGEIYGLTEADAALTPIPDISQPSAQVLGEKAPGVFMDYAQVRLILAEAAARGISVGGTAAEHYSAGIRASMEFWDENGSLTSSAIDGYLAQPGVDYTTLIGGGMTWKQVIGKQKWISLYMQGVQGWTEYRRLDFGILQMPAGGVLAGTGIPLRMEYPVDEQDLNASSYAAAVAAQGADDLDVKVWWDVN